MRTAALGSMVSVKGMTRVIPMVAVSPGMAPRTIPAATPDNRTAMLSGVKTRSEEHTSELQSLMRTSYAVFCLKKNKHKLKCMKTVVNTTHLPHVTNHGYIKH